MPICSGSSWAAKAEKVTRMAEVQIRVFQAPQIRLFELSPLYAEPGWYGTQDGTGTVGPFPSKDEVLRTLAMLAGKQPGGDS